MGSPGGLQARQWPDLIYMFMRLVRLLCGNEFRGAGGWGVDKNEWVEPSRRILGICKVHILPACGGHY